MAAQVSAVGSSVMKKTMWRLIPLLAVLYIIAYLDRVNIGFAALRMNAELGLSATAFGLGASIFFISYLLCEVPSNLALHKVGARIWIARILISWGIISMATGLVQNEMGLYIVRFLLGAAEAGFFPAVIVYMSYWFPAAVRTKVTALFLVAIPISSVIGAPLSVWIMNSFDQVLAISGWRWMFFIEGAPAVIMGVLCLWLLVDRPENAKFLNLEERAWLQKTLAAEEAAAEGVRKYSVLQTLVNPRVLLLAGILFAWNCTNYGISFWLPQIVGTVVGSEQTIGLIVAGIWLITAIIMVFWAWKVSRFPRPLLMLGASFGFAGSAMVMAGVFIDSPGISAIFITLALIGAFSGIPIFWTIPTSFLTGAAAAAGVAMINSLSQFAGLFAPWAIGVTKESTGGFQLAIVGLGVILILAVVLVSTFERITRRDRQGTGPQRSEPGLANATNDTTGTV